MTKQETNSAVKSAIALQRETLSGSMDINNVLTTSTQVHPLFQTHYTNMETAENGITALIKEILTANEAVFPKGIEETEFRPIALAASMFASEIIEQVQSRFSNGSMRYPYKTVHQYLSIFMTRSGKVGKIKLSNTEDKPRPCNKPRTKWYLVEAAKA